MDLIKIGRFIANLRKDKKLTQEQLAEKLMVTDRAVSKWERGLSLPDASKMIELCTILDINVNELLMGEKINMKDMNKKTDELLVELARQDELKNKKLMTNMWVLLGTSAIFYIGIIYLAIYTLKEGPLLGTIVGVSTAVFVIVAFYALKLEVDAGYYKCNNCGHRFIPTYWAALWAPHFHTTRYLKCPECSTRSWAKKVMTKD